VYLYPKVHSICVRFSERSVTCSRIMRRQSTPLRDHRPRFGRAVVVAPLAAPLAMFVGSAIRSIVSPAAAPTGINPIASAVFGAVLLLLYGAPLAYGSTVILLWPIAVLLGESRLFRWWTVTPVSGVAGAIVFPLYLHALAPRGTWDFFPGAGFVAGAATGCVFWFMASFGVKLAHRQALSLTA
jgi:hypothetical protein